MIAFNSTIEAILLKHKEFLAGNYDMYRNHVYRVFMFCQLQDGSNNNSEKYAIASAYHDIGIWTDHTFDYLNPSIKMQKSIFIPLTELIGYRKYL